MSLSDEIVMHMIENDMSTAFCCNSQRQTTMANLTLPEAIMSKVEIFAMY